MSDQFEESPGLPRAEGQTVPSRRALLAGAAGLAVLGVALPLVSLRAGVVPPSPSPARTGHFIIVNGWVIPEDLLQGRDHAV